MGISKARLSTYALLRHKKYRVKEGLFIVQGEKAVNDTIDKYEVEAILLHDYKGDLATIKGVPLHELSENEMRKISTLENLPHIAAVCRIPNNTDNLKVDAGEFCLVLDGVQDPGNLGTILRTAHWFGIKRVFCSRETVDIYNPKVVMATMGSIASINVVYCDLVELFDINNHLPVYGLLLHGENIFHTQELEPGFIVMGSEGHGPASETCGLITRGLTIPPANPTDHPDSLNVAVATAITLSQLLK